MQMDQYMFRSEGSMSDAKSRVPSQTAAEFGRSYNAHEIVDAITAMMLNAEAGLNWLYAEPPDMEGARQALNRIARDGKRAAELVVRLRALTNKLV